MLTLVRPTAAHLDAYCAALRCGWSADNVRGAAAAGEELERISDDADAFLALMDDPLALGGPVTLPDGRQVERLPGLRRWMWDDAHPPGDEAGFVGAIGLRWAKDGGPLPPHVLGHIGYGVVPWQRRRGHATRALALMLAIARERGLAMVEITTDPDNEASQRVITANGGVLVGPFDKGAAYGHAPGLRWRIELAPV